VDIREDQFAVITQNAPRVLADDPPDLMRLPQVSELVKDGLLKNLDGTPGVRLGQVAGLAARADALGPGGRRAARARCTRWAQLQHDRRLLQQEARRPDRHVQPPPTLADFDAVLPKAKAAGITPITSSTAARPAACASRCRT
jgi:raffinose/stachyose/melibiose transport system substrate-binding protein